MQHANDNTPRPQWFDSLLLQYDGFIRSKCGDDEDLYQDATLRLLSRWHQYRPNGNFVAWAGYHINSIQPEAARRAKRGEKYPHYNPPQSYEPAQEYYTDMSLALGRIGGRTAAMLAMKSVGYNGEEIGNRYSISRERVRQILAAAANDNARSDGSHKVNDAAA